MSAYQPPLPPPHRFIPHDPDATPPPTPFTPLFTLISSTTTQTNTPTSTTTTTIDHHHPTVHYIFTSDPDPLEPTTRAALSSLSSLPQSTPSPNPNTNIPASERYIILDLDATGTKIVNAASLSAEWQITSAEIGPAPTWEWDGEGGGRLMVRVEGCEGCEDGEMRIEEGEGDVESLMEGFERRMGELRRVVEAGGGMGRDEGRVQGNGGEGEGRGFDRKGEEVMVDEM